MGNVPCRVNSDLPMSLNPGGEVSVQNSHITSKTDDWEFTSSHEPICVGFRYRSNTSRFNGRGFNNSVLYRSRNKDCNPDSNKWYLLGDDNTNARHLSNPCSRFHIHSTILYRGFS